MKSSRRSVSRIALCDCGFILVACMAMLTNASLTHAQEISVSRLNLDSTAVRHISGRITGGETQGVIPGGTTYDLSHTVGTAALGFFLINDPSFPGESDNIVNFDGIPEPLATDINGTVVTVNETDVAGVGTTHTITITATSPLGTDMFPLLTAGGFPLTDGAIFLGTVDRVDTDPGSVVDSSSLEFFTNGISVAGPFDVAGIVGNADGVWEGDMGVSIGNLAGFGVNGWTLITQVTEGVPCGQGNCPTDITPPGGNGTTNIDDLIAVLNDFGSVGPPRTVGDITPSCGNWAVNIDDLIAVLNGFGPCPFVPGDLCADAIVVVDGANAFDSTAFTDTLDPLSGVNQCEFGDPQLDDIWFVWTAPAGPDLLNVSADLCGTLFDAAMSVFPNDCALTLDPINALGCGDDNAAACAGTFQPEVTWVATPGNSYLLVASGWQGGGVGTLNISSAPITNDDCTGAIPLIVNGVFIAGNNIGALTEVPAATDCGPSTDGLSLGGAPIQSDGGTWFSVIGTGNVLKANTCDLAQLSFYPTFVNVYCGGCPLQFCIGDSNAIVCGFGPYAEIDWCSALGEEYLILIHGQDLAGGAETFSLRVEDALVPCANAGLCFLPTDTCDSAGSMTFNAVTEEHIAAVDNTLMNTTIPTFVGNCGGNAGTFGGTPGSKDQWFTFTANTSGNARVDTCGSGFDTIINLWAFPAGGECELTNANIVVCNDDATNGGSDTCGIDPPPINPFFSGVEVQITAGTVYHISVSEWGTGGPGGTAQIRVTENFVAFGACQVGGVCSPNVSADDCASVCGDFFTGVDCIDVPTGACCLGGACLGIDTRQGCGAFGSAARFTAGAITCVGIDCTDSCTNAVASNGPFNGVNGIRPTTGFAVLGVIDDFTLDTVATLTGVNLGMIYNVGGGAGPVSGAIQYEITLYALGASCASPQIADLDPISSIPVAGPVVLTGVTLTLGAPAFGGHHEIVDGDLPVPIVLGAGHYAVLVRVLDDPLNLFWGTANAAASGSADESAVFGVDLTPASVNAPDDQRDHAICFGDGIGGPPPPPPPTGACCLPDGFCFINTALNCSSSGGIYQGDGITCATANCPPPPPPTGACCLPSNACISISFLDCQAQNGEYQGDGVLCGAVNCGGGGGGGPTTGACCLFNGNCIDGITPAACAAQPGGGTYQGNGSSCAGVTCPIPPPPTGACCLPNTSCIDNTTFAACLGLGGTYQGTSSTCATSTCPPPGSSPFTYGSPVVTETIAEPIEHASGDLVGADGFPDVVLVIPDPNPLNNGQIQIMQNLGNDPGGWLGLNSFLILTVGREPTGVAVADLNGDGHLDIAVCNAGDGNVLIFFNDPAGSGAFGPLPSVDIPVDEGGGERPLSIAAADFTGDLLIDIVVGNGVTNSVTLLTNTPAPPLQAGPGFPRTQDIAVGTDPVEVCPIDVDNDKDIDLVVANLGGNTVSALKNQPVIAAGPGAPFNPALTATLSVGLTPLDLTVGDIDGNGFLDFVTSNDDGTISVVLNDGISFNDTLPDIPVGTSTRSINIGDFDGDLDPDLTIAADTIADGPTILQVENLFTVSGEIHFGLPFAFSVGADPNFVINADLNNDAKIDLSTANFDAIAPSGGSVSVRINTTPP